MNFYFDPDCLELARRFLDDDKRPWSPGDADELAQDIQDAIEDWFFTRDRKVKLHRRIDELDAKADALRDGEYEPQSVPGGQQP